MLCDGDAIYDIGIESVQSHLSDRLKVLPRYHIENYFLDEQVLSDVFAQMEPDGSILRSPENLGEKLRLFARQTVPVAVALYVSAMIREKVGNVDVMPKGIHQASIDELIAAFQSSAKSEIERVGKELDLSSIEAMARQKHSALLDSIEKNTELWKRDIPGRIILNRFASSANMKVGRLKTMYLKCAQDSSSDPFAEIRQLFSKFRK